jgi:hypothetical protein
MKKLLLKILLLAFPFILLFSVPGYVLIKGRELYSYEQITRIHNRDSNSLIGLAYSNPDKYMKLQSTLERRPEVLALGTSRVMQVRSGFFNPGVSFYNAGGAVEKVRQFEFFLRQLPSDYKPRVLIVSLDQYFFNNNFDDLTQTAFAGEYKDKFSLLAYVFENCIPIWKKVFQKKINFSEASAKNSFGVNAIQNRNGFLHDGCYYYGTSVTHPELSQDYHFTDTYSRIEKGERRFQYGREVNSNALAVLDSFLKYCSTKNIHVVGFLPPYAPSVYQKMRSMGDKYAYMDQIFSTSEPVFKKYGFGLYDFTDPAGLNMKDENFVDGFHGSDRVYLGIMRSITRSEPQLQQFSNVGSLDTLHARLKNNIEVF